VFVPAMPFKYVSKDGVYPQTVGYTGRHVKDKHSSLLGPFISYEVNQVLCRTPKTSSKLA